uniref:Cysteine-rich DPF motif domain-containing protein 1 n=1 Tax=Biomphalaria glabrata TaxID=6526 RepID=A0A2C9KLZ3_BIOGL
MAEDKQQHDRRLFSCTTCDFTVDYHYKGRKPPFANCILLHEECYVLKDPFSSSGGFVTVGGLCSMCNRDVCLSNGCSLFYTQRFCTNCSVKHIQEFPHELQQEIMHKLKS